MICSLHQKVFSRKDAKAQSRSLPFAPWRLCVVDAIASLVILFSLAVSGSSAEQTSFAELQKSYGEQTGQVLGQYCLDCHSTAKAEGELDLERFATLADVRRDPKAWQKVAEMLDNGEMPPEDSEQPTETERKQLRSWIESYLHAEALANAGDPGPIVLRRLSNAEYNYTIQDLTGVDSLDPTREFPVDGAAGEGFTNTGSAQGMSPSLVQKYLDAAKQVAEHAVLLPDGIRFSPHTSRRDHTDELLARIQAFYRQFTEDGGGSSVDLQGIKFDTNQGGLLPVEKYLTATLAEREAITSGTKTISDVATERALSPRYLDRLWQALVGASTDNSLLLDALRTKWRRASTEDAPALAAEVVAAQKALWKFNPVGQIGREAGPKSWMEPATLESLPDELRATLPESPEQAESMMRQFRELFPAALCYAKIVPVDEVVTLTLFHRDDDHLQRLMLDEDQVAELERLWDELYYVSQEPLQLVVALEQITQFATQDRQDLVPQFAALKQPIEQRAEKFRQRLARTEAAHLDAVVTLADRAWRRKVAEGEQHRLRELYQSLRSSDLSHEVAIRLTLARILASPAFLYRLEQPGEGELPTQVTSTELASRLSYFLWSSLPDDELRHAAEVGELHKEATLLEQTRRMLDDSRTRRLAIQFACQWLHVRNFDQEAEKNEKLYPEFADLRDDMYEETVRFFEDMFRNDGSILSMLDADHTFVNEALAKHYGIPWSNPNPKRERGTNLASSLTLRVEIEDQWRRVAGAKASGRGGLLGMATILASQSGASRTSPILRGNWVYETLLGERLPRPPAGVPVLPDEPPEGLTARQLIEQHSSVEACARCHLKIDPFGFALEQYDAIGRRRATPVDTTTKLIEGQSIDGIDGLKDYLLNDRRDDVVRQFCRKLLGYSLGREVLLSDRPLLDTMMSDLEKNGYRFSAVVKAIVLSDQFRKIRGIE
ncbi:MAG TPA: DUF1592 domain-containing protein [Pirellulaceae bacterium]|nr:DUF1592 domain-containing protein [Pirellulaceae bacterium]